MNLVFMGSPEFAVPSLRRLAASSHVVLQVVTQPDRPAGRGRRTRPSPVAEAATGLGLPVLKPDDFRSPGVVSHLTDLGAEAFVVVAFGEILRKKHLAIPTRGCVNVHPSLLPRHRGAVPIPAALLAGDDVTGVTTILMDRGVDTGDILLQRAVEVAAGEDAGSLHDRLSELGAALVVETLDELEAGTLRPLPQDEERATTCGRLVKEDGRLDFSLDALSLYRRVRAMTPWPGAFTERGRERIAVLRAEVVDVVTRDRVPGRLLGSDSSGHPLIGCSPGVLRLTRVKPAGSEAMAGADYLRGHPALPGEVWGSSRG